MIKLNLFVLFFFLLLLISCKENTTEPTDSEKPTVVIMYPANGAEVKADTLYKLIADASDNKGITKVEFYIDGQNAATDNSSPYEYNWNTTGLSGDHTIFGKGYDEAGNIGTSAVVTAKINGVANHVPNSQGMVSVAGGTFTAGSTPVTISSFKIDKYEVTYELWTDVQKWALSHGYTNLVAGTNGYSPNGENNPVTTVNWYDIVKWCNARSEKEGLTPVYYTDNTQATVYRTGDLNINLDAVKWNVNGYRLPTECEWEFAARGGNSTHGYTYSGSNTVDDVAWYNSNSGLTTHTVGQKSANELGIYDMSGNAWEWCWDWYSSTYPSGTTDPKGPTSQQHRLLRGDSFYYSEGYCRVDFRYVNCPGDRFNDLGFRCVQN